MNINKSTFKVNKSEEYRSGLNIIKEYENASLSWASLSKENMSGHSTKSSSNMNDIYV